MTFVAATFLSAFLVFLVQPMLGRFLLPWFGGGPSVWTICLLFFQVGLLAGYAYAHLLVARLRPRRGVALHLALVALSLALLPVTPAEPAAGTPPVTGILRVLLGSVGLPYVLLSATAPLLQAWAARAGREPYKLYAWSNAGSLLALLAYPLVVEPALGVVAQTRAWSGAYALLAVLLALCARSARGEAREAAEAAEPPKLGDRVLWVALTACASTYLVATTQAISEDISASPLLWVLPLGLYLLTFIVCFGRPAWASRWVFVPALALALPAQGWALYQGSATSLLLQLALHSIALFAACMALHGEVVRLRPASAYLTGFYLLTAAGGALGGLFVGVVAPRVFPMRVELQMAMVGTGALVLLVLARSRRSVEWRRDSGLAWALAAAPLAWLAWSLWSDGAAFLNGAVWVRRGFFGVLQVKASGPDEGDGPALRLLNGRISHGRQFTDERRRNPVSYYGPDSGVGLLFKWRADAPPRRIAVVGLGVGTLAAFGRAGDSVTFFEINPDVVEAARTFFTYLADSPAHVDVVLGDARQSLRAYDGPPFDVLVLDAFSSDAIPAHLLTREAVDLYLAHLAPDGVLALNLSNRHLDLRPVVRAHAAARDLDDLEVTSESAWKQGIHRARWALLTRSPDLRPFLRQSGQLDLVDDPQDRVDWTDDSTPLLPILRALR